MNAIISLAIFVFLMALSVWGLVLAVTRRTPDRTYIAAAVVGESSCSPGDRGADRHRRRPSSTVDGEYLGYLVATVVLVPYGIVRARSPQANHWDAAVMAAVTFAVAVAVLRLLALW